MKVLLLIAGLAVSASAGAQDCKAIPSTELRLACYDGYFGKTFDPPVQTENAPGADGGFGQFLKELKLADESTPKGLGSDPATISLARRDGEEYSAVKAALTWDATFSPFPTDSFLARKGWGPTASFSINRNGLISKKVDMREGAFGFSGNVFQIRADKPTAQGDQILAMYTKLSAGYRRNKVEGSRSYVYRAENVFVSDYLRSGLPYQSPVAWYFVPRLGLFREDIREAKAGSPVGVFNSYYGIAKLEVYPAIVSDRIKLSFTAQKFRDFSVDQGQTRRDDVYAKASLEYLLFPPMESPAVQPSLALERSTGADPLNGAPKFGQTQLVLKVKIN